MSRLVDASIEELQKRRKLTVDSGYGDDYSDGRRDSLNAEQSIHRTSSLDSINEDDDLGESPSSRITVSPNDLVFKTMADKFQTLNTRNFQQEPKHQLTLPPTEMNTSSDNPEVSLKTKEKRRRMTPVPGSVTITKPSQGETLELFF